MTGNRTLEVLYHGRKVGTLAEMPDRRIAFQYVREWLEEGFSISPFSLPLRDDVFVPAEDKRERFRGLFGVFADSMPDSWGELLLDRYIESVGIKKAEITSLDRLAFVGSSGMGALEYYPSNEADFDIKSVGLNFDMLAKECRKILETKASKQLDLLFKMGGSSGGTCPKVLISDMGREWIVKFPNKNDRKSSGKREYEYSLCAKKCGINMTATELIPSAVCDGYFKTERFDRKGGQKIHCVTFAGLLEADFRAPSCSYETYMKLVSVLTKENEADKEQMFRIMCFNVFAHNLDDHTKNFSFSYTEDKGWRLAPAYDLTFSDTYWGEHTTSVNGKGKDISVDDLMKVGLEAGLPKKSCEKIINEVNQWVKSLAL